MRRGAEAIYSGSVVHRRVRPVRHVLRYKVFAVLFDCAGLEELGQRLRLFSYNRFNLFSLYDSDHGDGTPLPRYLDAIARQAGLADEVERFAMLCYPRILGYAFNPLTVYFGLDNEGGLRLTIYEVNNTFGERVSYVLPACPDADGVTFQHCAKQMYVSPFNPVSGEYAFHVTPLDDDLTVGVALNEPSGPVMLAFFRAKRSLLTDTGLLRALGRTGWMTVKVIIGIHLEALKLSMKGLRLVPRPQTPKALSDQAEPLGR